MAGMEPQNIESTVTSPSGTTQPCDLVNLGANRYTIKFIPREMGVHTVSLKHRGLHIPGLYMSLLRSQPLPHISLKHRGLHIPGLYMALLRSQPFSHISLKHRGLYIPGLYVSLLRSQPFSHISRLFARCNWWASCAVLQAVRFSSLSDLLSAADHTKCVQLAQDSCVDKLISQVSSHCSYSTQWLAANKYVSYWTVCTVVSRRL